MKKRTHALPLPDIWMRKPVAAAGRSQRLRILPRKMSVAAAPVRSDRRIKPESLRITSDPPRKRKKGIRNKR